MRQVLIISLVLALGCGTKSNGNNDSTDDAGSTTSDTDAGTQAPSVMIMSPSAGASVHFDATNTDVDVSFMVEHFTLKDPGQCGGAANCGHVELFIDGTTCNDTGASLPYNAAASASPAAVALDHCPGFPSVAGTHVISAELHHDDLSPVTDASGDIIKDEVTITAVEDSGADAGSDDGADAGTDDNACGSAANPIEVGPGMSFNPAHCDVAAGSTVHWHFNAFHNVTSEPGAAVTITSGNKSSGDFSVAIPDDATSGTSIPYRCTLHSSFSNSTCSGMCATLTVE